ncbi:zinc finger BED domain-containing protein RICESLEEPER 2 [Tanacetum coccineum]
MMKWVIAFEDFLVPHTDGALFRMLKRVFADYYLEDKILSITLDNASNNTKAIGKLRLRYEPPMEGVFYHSRCVAHIINLVVQSSLAMASINAIKESFKQMLKDIFKSELLIESITVDLECFDDGFAIKAKEQFIGYFQGFYNHYYLKYGNPTTQSTSVTSTSTHSAGNPMINLLNRLKDHSNKQARNDRSTSSEYERYLHSDCISFLWPDEFMGFDVLGFWKAKESMFPILSRMARDMLSVQATLVASKSAFSTIERVLSIQRTRLTPASLEMCMCLKDHLDAQDRIQNTSSLEHSLDFEEDILEAEVQDNEAIPLFDEEIALDEVATEAMSNGSSSGWRRC